MIMIMINYNVLQKRLISQQINSPGEYALLPAVSIRSVTIGSVTIGSVTIGSVTIGSVTIGSVTIMFDFRKNELRQLRKS